MFLPPENDFFFSKIVKHLPWSPFKLILLEYAMTVLIAEKGLNDVQLKKFSKRNDEIHLV